MGHHHKSNQAVEGATDYSRSRGMPLRPDLDALELRADRDRREMALPAATPLTPQAAYLEVQAEVDRRASTGELPTGTVTRKTRAPFPPTGYQD
ncbi:hypothetical protein [Streptomyces adustus]